MKKYSFLPILLAVLLFYTCKDKTKNTTKEQKIELVTDFGSIIIKLYNETPGHGDNFIKLTKEGFFNGVQWHRVIDGFLIQTGDPTSIHATDSTEIGAQDAGYSIPAEIKPNLLHKRGALNAAREGDDVTPARMSSSSQFTIIQGRVYSDSLLDKQQERINEWRSYNTALNLPRNTKYHDFLNKSIMNNVNLDSVNTIKKLIKEDAKIVLDSMTLYHYPAAHREIYKTLGGAAHLDQNYTVFGEVLEGMDIVDSIARVETRTNSSRPVKPVRILKAKLLN